MDDLQASFLHEAETLFCQHLVLFDDYINGITIRHKDGYLHSAHIQFDADTICVSCWGRLKMYYTKHYELTDPASVDQIFDFVRQHMDKMDD